MGTKRVLIPISERALFQRIDRALAKAGEKLRKARSDEAAASLGAYFIIDLKKKAVVRVKVDLVDLGRKLKILAPYERLRGK